MFKGIPAKLERVPLRDVGRAGLRLFDDALALPAAIIRKSALEHNASWMAEFARSLGLSLAPHGKTTMSPDLFALQLRHGAWAITAATAHHARLYASWGIVRILIANQITGAANVAIIAQLLERSPALELTCLCDSVEGVRALNDAVARPGSTNRLRVLVEIGGIGQRAGVRSIETALAVARACRESPALLLCGVECFEGVYAQADEAVGFLDHFVTCANAIDTADLWEGDEIVISAGGSLFFDEAARAMLRTSFDRPTRLVLRSGCYLTHDHGMYGQHFPALQARGRSIIPPGELEPALEVWAHIQSRPEPMRAVASLGKRDVSCDVHLPIPLHRFRPGRDKQPLPLSGITVVKLFDQHACLDLPANADLAVGDLIGFGISHPCTTFDKWQVIFVVDETYQVVDTITTEFG